MLLSDQHKQSSKSDYMHTAEVAAGIGANPADPYHTLDTSDRQQTPYKADSRLLSGNWSCEQHSREGHLAALPLHMLAEVSSW